MSLCFGSGHTAFLDEQHVESDRENLVMNHSYVHPYKLSTYPMVWHRVALNLPLPVNYFLHESQLPQLW